MQFNSKRDKRDQLQARTQRTRTQPPKGAPARPTPAAGHVANATRPAACSSRVCFDEPDHMKGEKWYLEKAIERQTRKLALNNSTAGCNL